MADPMPRVKKARPAPKASVDKPAPADRPMAVVPKSTLPTVRAPTGPARKAFVRLHGRAGQDIDLVQYIRIDGYEGIGLAQYGLYLPVDSDETRHRVLYDSQSFSAYVVQSFFQMLSFLLYQNLCICIFSDGASALFGRLFVCIAARIEIIDQFARNRCANVNQGCYHDKTSFSIRNEVPRVYPVVLYIHLHP